MRKDSLGCLISILYIKGYQIESISNEIVLKSFYNNKTPTTSASVPMSSIKSITSSAHNDHSLFIWLYDYYMRNIVYSVYLTKIRAVDICLLKIMVYCGEPDAL